ncbi:MAG: hypothetical protein Q7R64_04220 [bacterium]|nr:hypothetical protein [bacterium]
MFLIIMEDIPQPPAEFPPGVYVPVLVIGLCFAVIYVARAISGRKEERDACEEEE